MPMNVFDLARHDDLIELHLNGRTVSILGVLNQEDHQEDHDGSIGIDNKLPCIGEVK